ncbi:MAG: hypothetical protein LAT68_17160, partial [Cyclobacteriaceae bacterium]|nr:hypothetical protein [Cyclobacteriaceae bacterium]
MEKGNTYNIILNIDASTFEPHLEFGFCDGNRKLYEYYVHKSDTEISYTFKPQETKTYRINLRMRQAGYEGEAQTFYVKSAAIHQYQ